MCEAFLVFETDSNWLDGHGLGFSFKLNNVKQRKFFFEEIKRNFSIIFIAFSLFRLKCKYFAIMAPYHFLLHIFFLFLRLIKTS